MKRERFLEYARLYRRLWLDRSGIRQFGRVPLFDPGLPVIFLTSQKAGSTSALKWYFDKLGILEEALSFHPFAHTYEQQVFKKRPGYESDVRRALQTPDIPVVKFVRDPAARALSGYNFLTRQSDPATRALQISYWRRRMVAWVHGQDADIETRVSFLEYLRWLASENPRSLDGHLGPQRLDLEAGLGGRLQIVKIEHIPEAFDDLEARYGLAVSSEENQKKILSSKHHNEKSTQAASLEKLMRVGLEVGRVGKNTPKFDTSRLAEFPEAEELIRRVFAADYAAYAY